MCNSSPCKLFFFPHKHQTRRADKTPTHEEFFYKKIIVFNKAGVNGASIKSTIVRKSLNIIELVDGLDGKNAER